jgi:hypothetical protein
MGKRNSGLGLAVMTCGLLLAAPALADVIDGNWCRDDGRRFSIEGPTIVTVTGHKTQGDYTRHSFRYTVPESDPGAGQDVFMRLLNELTLSLRVGADGAPEIWQRCKPTTS